MKLLASVDFWLRLDFRPSRGRTPHVRISIVALVHIHRLVLSPSRRSLAKPSMEVGPALDGFALFIAPVGRVDRLA